MGIVLGTIVVHCTHTGLTPARLLVSAIMSTRKLWLPWCVVDDGSCSYVPIIVNYLWRASRDNSMIGARLEYQHQHQHQHIQHRVRFPSQGTPRISPFAKSALCHAPNVVRPAKNHLGDRNDGMVHSKGSLHILVPQRCPPSKGKPVTAKTAGAFSLHKT